MRKPFYLITGFVLMLGALQAQEPRDSTYQAKMERTLFQGVESFYD